MHTTARTEPGTAPVASAPPGGPPATSRHDSYLGIHKALRLFMTDTLARVGRTDPDDDAEVGSTLEQVRELLGLCELHVKDENDFLHPALERARTGSAARAQQEHAQHLEAIHDLGDLAGLIADTRDTARAAALARLYRAMALFVAENFEHMHLEETEHNAVLWAHYSDAELLGIEHELVASIPPQAMVKALHWFMPALNAPERAAMLKGMQRGMPPEAFLGIVDIARRTLTPPDFAKLTEALGLPPSPRPVAG
jgi:hypothetical protein